MFYILFRTKSLSIWISFCDHLLFRKTTLINDILNQKAFADYLK